MVSARTNSTSSRSSAATARKRHAPSLVSVGRCPESARPGGLTAWPRRGRQPGGRGDQGGSGGTKPQVGGLTGLCRRRWPTSSLFAAAPAAPAALAAPATSAGWPPAHRRGLRPHLDRRVTAPTATGIAYSLCPGYDPITACRYPDRSMANTRPPPFRMSSRSRPGPSFFDRSGGFR